MIKIKTLASGSSGNAYWISDGHTELLIECGIRFKDIQTALDFKTSNLSGCLVTHEHGDHAKGVKDVLKAGIDVYASYGTWDALLLDGHHRAHPVKDKHKFTIGTWTIMPFNTKHDAAEPLGFFMMNQENERLVFITDSFYSRYTFEGLTHIMVECNYSMDILNANIESGLVPKFLKNRLIKSHFSLENVIDFLKANDLSKVQEIHLLHLSDRNSDRNEFKKVVQEATGKAVYTA